MLPQNMQLLLKKVITQEKKVPTGMIHGQNVFSSL